MFHHESLQASGGSPTAICPDCGSTLRHEDESLHCDTHGSFFLYSSHVIVRCAPAPQDQPLLTLLPWQTLAECNAVPT